MYGSITMLLAKSTKINEGQENLQKSIKHTGQMLQGSRDVLFRRVLKRRRQSNTHALYWETHNQ